MSRPAKAAELESADFPALPDADHLAMVMLLVLLLILLGGSLVRLLA